MSGIAKKKGKPLEHQVLNRRRSAIVSHKTVLDKYMSNEGPRKIRPAAVPSTPLAATPPPSVPLTVTGSDGQVKKRGEKRKREKKMGGERRERRSAGRTRYTNLIQFETGKAARLVSIPSTPC